MNPKHDPAPYDGPIERADGVRPWNRYLWPTEEWWPGHDRNLSSRVGGRFSFEYVALADGRFSTEGCVYAIEQNRDIEGRPCLFVTRVQAIRASAARMIRTLRYARKWDDWSRVDAETYAAVVNWTLKKVAEATDAPPPAEVHVRPDAPAPAPNPFAGLPLFEIKGCINVL